MVVDSSYLEVKRDSTRLARFYSLAGWRLWNRRKQENRKATEGCRLSVAS
jgi:hypothetical protein